MKVKDLKAVLEIASDDTEVLLEAHDHGFRKVEVAKAGPVNRGKGRQRGEWWEYGGIEHQVPDMESDVVIAVVVS